MSQSTPEVRSLSTGDELRISELQLELIEAAKTNRDFFKLLLIDVPSNPHYENVITALYDINRTHMTKLTHGDLTFLADNLFNAIEHAAEEMAAVSVKVSSMEDKS